MVIVVVRTQDPETFVPSEATFRLSMRAATVVPAATVGVPMSMHHSFHTKFASPVEKVALNVRRPPDCCG